MFNKVLFSAAMLLLASYSANAMTIKKCGDITPKDCIKEMSIEMDKKMMTMMKEIIKTQMIKMMDICTAVKKEMPTDGIHSKMMTIMIDDMKTQMDMLEKMDITMDMEKMESIMTHCITTMLPNMMKAQTEDTTNAEKFIEMMKKHGYKKDMMKDMMTMMMKDFETICEEMIDIIREEDIKEYPQIKEMKEIIKTMKDTTDYTDKMIMMMKIMKKMTDTMDMPCMKTILNMMTMGA